MQSNLLDIPKENGIFVPICKAKRLDNGKWIEGFCCIDTLVGGCPEPYLAYTIRTVPDKVFGGIWAEIDINTLCQNTGVPDAKKTDIFSGDILHINYHKEEDVYVKYVDGEFRLIPLQNGFGRFKGQPLALCFTAQNIQGSGYKVVGNIHDFPEILKELEEVHYAD